MKKFELMALRSWIRDAVLTKEDESHLIELIEATPNPTIALELLLNVYEPIEIPAVPVNTKEFQSSYKLISFESFNRIKNEVTFRYCLQKEKQAWTPKTAETTIAFEDITPELEEYNGTAYAKNLGLTMTEFREKYQRLYIKGPIDESKSYSSTCQLNKWLGENK